MNNGNLDKKASDSPAKPGVETQARKQGGHPKGISHYDHNEGNLLPWEAEPPVPAPVQPSYDPALDQIQQAIDLLQIAIAITKASNKEAIRKVCAELEEIEWRLVEEPRHYPDEAI